MNYLLDTHVLIWLVSDESKISKKAKDIYLDKANTLYFSDASLWEMSIKISLGKLKLPISLSEFIKKCVIANNVKRLPISTSHILGVETLPFHHRDPFDRLLISQANAEKLDIISSDVALDNYDCNRTW